MARGLFINYFEAVGLDPADSRAKNYEILKEKYSEWAGKPSQQARLQADILNQAMETFADQEKYESFLRDYHETRREQQERAARDRAQQEKERAERDEADRERSERERPERERPERERPERERPERERPERERPERERPERERPERERPERERPERERPERERPERERPERERGGTSSGSQTVLTPAGRGGKLGWTIIGVAALITAGSYKLTWFNVCDVGVCSREWGFFGAPFMLAGLVPAIAILIYLAVRGLSKAPRPQRSPFLIIAASDSLVLVIYNCLRTGGGPGYSLSYGAYIAIGAAVITLLTSVLSRSPSASAVAAPYANGGELGWTILSEAALITAASYMLGWFRTCSGIACNTVFGLIERPFMIVGMFPAIAILIYLAVRGLSKSRSPRRSIFLIAAAIVSLVFVMYNALAPPLGYEITYGAFIGIAAGIVTLLAAAVIRA